MQNPSGNITNTQTQVTDFSSLFSISTIVEKLGNIASSNFGLDNVINTLGAIDVETGKVAKTFGIGQIEAEGITDAIIASRDEVFKLGGTWNDLYTTQTETSQALQRNVTLSVEGQKSLFAASEVSQQSVSKIVTSLKDVGISAYDAGKAMGQVVNAAREQGVSAKVVSEMVLKNVSSMNLYNFRDGVEGLSKMAAQATAMRIDMKTILDVAEKAFDPKGAIEMAASLQRLGVTQSELLDPLSLMNMAENDPAELQNQIAEMSKQFVQMNKDGQFEILPGAKRQMREIAKALNMNVGDLQKMALSSAEAEEKMKRIKFPSFADEEQKKMLANLSEMKDGKMMITINGEAMELDKALADAEKQGREGIDKLLEAAKPKTVEDLAVDQLDVLKQINSGINLLSGVLPAAAAGTKEGKALVRGMGSAVRTAGVEGLKMVGGTTGVSESLSSVFSSASNGFASLKLSEVAKKFANLGLDTASLGEGFKNLKKKIEKIGGGSISTSISADAQKALDFLTKNVFNASDAILSPKLGTFKTLEEDDIYVGTGLSTMFEKLSELKSSPPVEPSKIISEVPQIIKEKETTTAPKESSKEFKIELEVKFPNLPPQIDTAQIVKVLKDQFVVQQLIEKMEQVSTNNNLTKMPK